MIVVYSWGPDSWLRVLAFQSLTLRAFPMESALLK